MQCLQSLYQAIARGDLAAFAEMLADDVDLEIFGPPDHPFLGRWRGRQQVADAVRANFAMIDAQEPELQSLVAQGDTVVAIARERGRFRESGQDYHVQWVQVHTFRDGQLVRTRQLVAELRDLDISETV